MVESALYKRGLVMTAAGAVLLSPDGLLVRLVQDAGVWEILFYRMLFFGLALLVVLALQGDLAARTAALGWPDLALALLFAASSITFVLALQHTTVANTLLFMATTPLLGGLLGWFANAEKVPPRTWAAIAVAFAGMSVIFADSAALGSWHGDAIAAANAVIVAIILVFLRRHSRDVLPGLCLNGFAVAAVAFPFAGSLTLGTDDLVVLSVMGFGVLPISLCLFYAGARHVPPAEAALLAMLETVLGPLLVWAAVGETPTTQACVGGAAILLAIGANALQGMPRQRAR